MPDNVLRDVIALRRHQKQCHSTVIFESVRVGVAQRAAIE